MDFKARFFKWFGSYRPGQSRWLVRAGADSGPDLGSVPASQWVLPAECKPELSVDINELRLRTPCPGHAHILKFAYNPGMVALSGEPLFIASPGYIGLIPTSQEVVIRFGGRPGWVWADRISGLFALTFVGLGILRRLTPTPGK